MPELNHEQLTKDGYGISQTFRRSVGEGMDISDMGFHAHGIGTVPEEIWLKSTFKLARGFGIFDLPMIREVKDRTLEHTFYFKNTADSTKFMLAVEGNFQRKADDQMILVFTLEDDESDEMLPHYKEAAEIFSINYDIDCRIVDVAGKPRNFGMGCASLADIAAMQIAFSDKERIRKMAYTLFEQSKPGSGPTLKF